MKTYRALLFFTVAISTSIAAAACGGGGQNSTGGDGGNAGTGGAGGAVGSQAGVPCEVAQVLADKCFSCHGEQLHAGAPMSLVTYEDLVAPSKADPSKTVIERCVIRMEAATAPMPPAGGAAADAAALQAWIDAGTPKGDCTDVFDPFAAPLGCVSGQEWDPQGEVWPEMYPGQACITCHKSSGGLDTPPIFYVAGTVYPSGHETDNCYGIDGTSPDFSDVMVEITDANGVLHSLKPGPTGNFYLEEADGFAYPYKAKVVSSKGERAMAEAQMDGDCNACHTAEGGGAYSMAPGRIVIPY